MSTPAPTFHTNSPVTIIGRQIRTDSPGSATQIPALWQEVADSGILAAIPGKLSNDVYAVYTNLEHAGLSRDGYFSFIIGAPVAPGTPPPTDLTLVTIPASPRATFPAPENDRTRVIEAWEQAWAYDDRLKTFICEYELYTDAGEVSVNLGVRGPADGAEIR